eukprot:COSAG01_NODE_3355_length_6214_cov_2.843009_10_plen_71_part_00
MCTQLAVGHIASGSAKERMASTLFAVALAGTASAAPTIKTRVSDKVTQLPGFDPQPFDVYSGFLKVDGEP